MRPPAMQTAALQPNNELHNDTQRQRLLQQQQQNIAHLPLHLRQQQPQQLQLQLQFQQQQQQPQTTPLTLLNQSSYDPTAAATAQQARNKYYFEQHEFTVDKPLNFVSTTTTASAKEAVNLNARRSSVASIRLPIVDEKSRQEQLLQRQHAQPQAQPQPQGASLDCIQLLDLSTSPPHEPIYPLQGSVSAYLPQRSLADVPPPYRRASAASVAPVPTHRASYASQYSRSSSSEDGSIGGVNAAPYPNSYTRANSAFDDAAEHFIINFPAADSPSHNQNDCVINLPLSETEPLLTNIEATVADKQRSIRLPKSSASLIFTKKDLLPQRTASVAPYQAANTNNNCATQQKQQQTKQPKRNQTKQQQQQQQQQQQLHHSLSLRSANEYATRKPVKHLPASYQQHQPQQQQQLQQQRRSLQLNYNNNLVTTSTCCSANNNYCSSATGKGVRAPSANAGGGGSKSVGAVLHKHHQPSAALSAAVAKAEEPQQQQQSGQINTNTAATTRKQHAYSWYAPVYTALEEELEQDSRDSSPIHNLANTKKQHLNHYQQQRSSHNSSTAADNETVALLETRNQVNIQAQLHAQANSHAHAAKDGNDISAVGGGNGVGSGSAVGVARNAKYEAKYAGLARRTNGGGPQAPTTLPLSNAHNAAMQAEMSGGESGYTDSQTTAPMNGFDGDVGLANSLGGTLPPRRRIENFLKSLVGRKSSSARSNSGNSINGGNVDVLNCRAENIVSQQPMPSSPEIKITRTPSEQNMVLLRETSQRGRQYKQQLAAAQEQRKSDCGGGDKLTVNGATQGSTSSLNVVQQKLWNIMRREGSAASLYNEKSHSIVQYRGLRKCETVLALTRQTNSLCSPIFGGSAAAHVGASGRNNGSASNGGAGVARHNSCSAGGGAGSACGGMRRTHTTGSGIFSTSGVEQIRPLNRLRNSVTSINAAATCSRCSSLLSLAASGSRYSLNVAANAAAAGAFAPTTATQMHTSASQQQLQALAATLDYKPPPHSSQQHQQQRERKISNVSSSQLNSSNYIVLSSNRIADTTVVEHNAGGSGAGNSSSGNCSRKSSADAPSTHSASSITPPSNMTTATLTSSITSPHASTPTTPVAAATAYASVAASVVAPDTLVITPTANAPQAPIAMSPYTANNTNNSNTSGILVDLPSSPTSPTSVASSAGTPSTSASCSSATTPAPTYALPPTSQTYPFTITSLLAMSKTTMERDAGGRCAGGADDDDVALTIKISSAAKGPTDIVDGRHYAAPAALPLKRFEPFTCKLCLVDVEAKEEATTLQQCGCEFCTECMKAYVDFEITEGAYEISCPDAQCPAQGIMTLPEIANLTTTNLMKKHHRYRLNKEIEMDKTRTWCPRAGCETVCLVGVGPHSDATPSTSTGGGSGGTHTATFTDSQGAQQSLCAVQCPSCKDEFCSACKKAWHPNMTCEENSRRLVADGQDDIGIPFDNDLIKCCPMCAVPIEKDEGCAQMMCKRCKHVFCWYCLASLDDDFLLRHYDRGPCKNKLGHSRASVVWHRAQVIGIFAGFGILLLVASPLLLLAAPCIICCKCRSCSGARIDEGDAELDEATALQSL